MYDYVDNAIAAILEKWKGKEPVSSLAKQMEVLGKNMAHLRGAGDIESRKKARLVWQKAANQYWELLWALVEAKIDYGPIETMEFDAAERLFIDYGHLSSTYTTPNQAFAEQLVDPTAVDMYQYTRLTDYICESYALIFGKPYSGPSGGVPLEDKLKRFENDLKMAKTRRRTALNMLIIKVEVIEKEDLEETLKNLEDGLSDAIETDMRTKRIREAHNEERAAIGERCKRYETAERTLWYLMDNIEKKLTKADEPKKVEPSPEKNESTDAAPPREEDHFDPFVEIGHDYIESAKYIKAAPKAHEAEEAESGYRPEKIEMSDDEPDSEATAETTHDDSAASAEELDQSLKIIQNVLALHDRTKFLAGLIVHVTNETERWKKRVEMAHNKYKKHGVPALKMELRDGINRKKEFMTVAARTARIDTSPLCQNKNKPISMARAGEIMMDLTPLDPDMLRASRIRMYGLPRVIMAPGQGLGVYDWEDNSLIIPIFAAVSDVKDFCFALAAFRWDNDEDRTLKDTYALLKVNKGKGIRALQEAFMNDYFLWISKERKGYRILPRDTSKWFKTFFKQKSGVMGERKK